MNDSTSDTIKVDTARLPLLLRELRLPTIGAMWQERADREGKTGQGFAGAAGGMPGEVGQRHGCSLPSPSWNSPNAISDASNDICLRPACPPAKRSTVSSWLLSGSGVMAGGG